MENIIKEKRIYERLEEMDTMSKGKMTATSERGRSEWTK